MVKGKNSCVLYRLFCPSFGEHVFGLLEAEPEPLEKKGAGTALNKKIGKQSHQKYSPPVRLL